MTGLQAMKRAEQHGRRDEEPGAACAALDEFGEGSHSRHIGAGSGVILERSGHAFPLRPTPARRRLCRLNQLRIGRALDPTTAQGMDVLPRPDTVGWLGPLALGPRSMSSHNAANVLARPAECRAGKRDQVTKGA